MNKNTYAQILDTLFQKSLDAIVIIDNMGIIQMANRAITKLFGYQVSETIGANIAIFLQNKIASEQNRDILQHLRPGPKSLLNQTLAFVHKNGTIFSCDISISEVILAEGEQLFAWTIRKVAAQEQPIAIIKALNPTPKEKELNELKTRFITTASHEFRTPLSTILSSAKLLGRYTESAEQEKRLKHIHRIQSAVNNLNLILDDLLTWSKLEEGKINYEPQPFNFKKLVNESMEEVMMIAKKDQQLIYNHHGHNNDIILDPSYLKNILLNLLSNAIKYSRAGDTIELNSHIDEPRFEYCQKIY